jgi:hypothetical protein
MQTEGWRAVLKSPELLQFVIGGGSSWESLSSAGEYANEWMKTTCFWRKNTPPFIFRDFQYTSYFCVWICVNFEIHFTFQHSSCQLAANNICSFFKILFLFIWCSKYWFFSEKANCY